MAFVAEKGGKLCCDWKGSLVLTVSLADPEKVTRYTIASANDYPGRDPSTWTLYASKDGLKWMPVDDQKGVEFPSRNYIREFSLAEPVTAKAFKLVVTAHGGDGKVQFSRVTFRR